MEVLFNELSIHGQFEHPTQFTPIIERLLRVRQLLKRNDLRLRCTRLLMQRSVTSNQTLQDAVRGLTDRNLLRLMMSWLSKDGPFWGDERIHSSDDMLLHGDDVVTDTSIGEAAMCVMRGLPRTLLSISPSDWERTPINVDHVIADGRSRPVEINNVWNQNQLEVLVKTCERPVNSWPDLYRWALRECPQLVFSASVVEPLSTQPFQHGACKRLQALLRTLNQLKESTCYDSNGRFNERGLEIYNQYFFGDRALFSDSSDTDKRLFSMEMTFPHPRKPDETLFCPWHGKVNTPKLRIHFSHPITAREPLYVVYIGPKITKR